MAKRPRRIVEAAKKAARHLEFGSAISPSVPKQDYERPRRPVKSRKTQKS